MSKINYNSKCGEFCCFKLLSYPFDFNVALLSVDGATLGPPSAPGCKQNLKNETKQNGPKSEYLLNHARSGALLD